VLRVIIGYFSSKPVDFLSTARLQVRRQLRRKLALGRLELEVTSTAAAMSTGLFRGLGRCELGFTAAIVVFKVDILALGPLVLVRVR
jgi:hypothetical protein